MKVKYIIWFGLLSVILFSCTGCSSSSNDDKINGRTHVVYWEKWTGFEGEAMQAVVDDFNASQNKIFVDKVIINQIDQKTLVSIAGGDPPDIAGLWESNISSFADKYALICLDDYAAKAGIKRENYIPIFWDICLHRKHLYGLPSTPASLALHWNRDMFRKAGLDPNRPPQSIQELTEFARKLTKRDKNGKIIQMGFLPSEPGWWNWSWGYYFGGKIWNGKDTITCNSPENIKAYEWVQSFTKENGVKDVQAFFSGFGNFASPQNAFLSGKVAMELQGVWMYNFIKNYAPNLNWDCAPFPSAIPGTIPASYVEADVLSIPIGAKHPNEAFEFIKYVESQKGMEKLCIGQRKFSPLIKVSDEFIKNHPNPYIKKFIELAKEPTVFSPLDMSIWNEYSDEMGVAYDKIWLQQATPKDALDLVQKKIQKKWDKELTRFRRLGWPIEQVPPGR